MRRVNCEEAVAFRECPTYEFFVFEAFFSGIFADGFDVFCYDEVVESYQTGRGQVGGSLNLEVVYTVGFGGEDEFSLCPFCCGFFDSQYFGVAEFVVGTVAYGQGVLANIVTGSEVLEAYFILLTGGHGVTVGYCGGFAESRSSFRNNQHVVAVEGFNACIFRRVNCEVAFAFGEGPTYQFVFEAFFCGIFADRSDVFSYTEVVEGNQTGRGQVSGSLNLEVVYTGGFGGEGEFNLSPFSGGFFYGEDFGVAEFVVVTYAYGQGVLANIVTGSQVLEAYFILLTGSQSITVGYCGGLAESRRSFRNDKYVVAVEGFNACVLRRVNSEVAFAFREGPAYEFVFEAFFSGEFADGFDVFTYVEVVESNQTGGGQVGGSLNLEVVYTGSFGGEDEFSLGPFCCGFFDSQNLGVAEFVVGAIAYVQGVLANIVTGSEVLEAYFILLTGGHGEAVGYYVGFAESG